MAIRDEELQVIRAEAQQADDRLRLYRARAYGMRATSPTRLRELERRATETAARLAHATVGSEESGA